MYCLSDKQIDYILNDISARGVEMESLQLNLHDHVCCIIENNLEENGDFESFYQKTIKTFYKDELWEIEEETLLLLTFKNYYAMKKIMIMSGIIAASTMILGMILKFMHWPGSSPFIILGISTSSLIFLPLLFMLKVKDQQQTKDKIILALGILSGILLSLSILFRVMHWPGSMFMGYTAVCVTGLVLLPLYFITSIKNPDNKINTITISITLIMVCGLWLTLIRSPKGSKLKRIEDTTNYLVNEQIVTTEKKLTLLKIDSVKLNQDNLADSIIRLCDNLKSNIILDVTGGTIIASDFEAKEQFLKEEMAFQDQHLTDLDLLLNSIKIYNSNLQTGKVKIPTTYESHNNELSFRLLIGTNLEALLQLQQIQLIVLQNERL